MTPARLALMAGLFLAIATAAHAADAYWQGVAEQVSGKLATVVEQFRAGDAKAARSAINDAYFGQFEDTKMEAAVRKERGAARARELEGMFGDLRKAVRAGDGGAVQTIAEKLQTALAEEGKALDAAGIHPDVFAVEE